MHLDGDRPFSFHKFRNYCSSFQDGSNVQREWSVHFIPQNKIHFQRKQEIASICSGGSRIFPRGVCQLPKLLLFFKFLSKTAWKWKNLDPGGGRVPGAPLDPPMICVSCEFGKLILLESGRHHLQCISKAKSISSKISGSLRQVWIRLHSLALKPRGDVTRGPKQGYQWPHKWNYVFQGFYFKKVWKYIFSLQTKECWVFKTSV